MGYSSRGVKANGCNSGPPRRQWWTSRPRKKTTAMATTATLTRSTHTKHPRSEPVRTGGVSFGVTQIRPQHGSALPLQSVLILTSETADVRNRHE